MASPQGEARVRVAIDRAPVNVTHGRACLFNSSTFKSLSRTKMELAANTLGQNKRAALLVGAAGVAVLGFGLGYKYLRRPEKVDGVGVVSKLLVHPLKSGRAVQVTRAECLNIGLKFGELRDR